MQKHEAIQALKDGKKISHRYFSSDEWASLMGEPLVKNDRVYNDILFEDGITQDFNEFWAMREDSMWDDGWYLYIT